ncbi:MAG: RHS repeat-associated core domain-containing protein [Crocinitomicaceae bacterium]|nr:RHS repeat-associated core domain-containing protein [Crocinitomicaceae bacterium]
MKSLIIVLIGVFFGTQLFAGQEEYSSRIEGTDIFIGATNEVYDVMYYDMSISPIWSNHYTNHRVNNFVRLGLNPEVIQSGVFSAELELRVSYEEWTPFGFVTSVEDRTLSVNYNDDGTLQIDDLSTFSFEGGHHVNVEVLNISPGVDVSNLFLETSIEIERYYSFDGGSVTGASYTFAGTNNSYIQFDWDVKIGAEYYELEFVHIHDYTFDPAVFQPMTALSYDFYLNSTRVAIKDNSYKIPAIFDHGYVLFRVRPIGVQGSNFDKRYDGAWNATENGIVAYFRIDQRIPVGIEYDVNMNWAHQIGYAEDGKRFEGISFMDGLGRGRQSVSHNTATEQAIVSNVYYDELGRPAISDLPTPVNGNELKHYYKFNRPESDLNESYQAMYFDDGNVVNDPNCEVTSAGFSQNYGAGKYYSPNNSDLDGENANIPDAEKFPFSRVTYLDDYTNRVKRIGAFGNDLKIGSGKETKMIYVSPNQTELNKLFGSEVGHYSHYQKMITIDANGQAYAQYTDMAGRVVASFMIGPSPSNIEAIQDNIIAPSTVDLLLNGNFQTTNAAPPSTTLTHYEYFAEDDTYTFNYGFTPAQYELTCLPANICFDCVYDLSISITDDCGVEVFESTVSVNGTTFDELCNGASTHAMNEQISLLAGRYAIEKTLTINQAAIDEYWCTFIDNSTCLTPLSEHFNALYTNEDFDNCNEDELQESLNACEAVREIMLEDVSPGGQYALYTDLGSDYTPADVASQAVLNNWNTGQFYDEQGVLFTPANLKDFVDNFLPEWADQLLLFHPEYCYLEFCELNQASDTYNEGMLSTDEFDVALTTGYFEPVSAPAPSNVFDGGPDPAVLDPFFNGGQGTAYLSGAGNMSDLMSSYSTYTLTNGVNIPITMWEYAVLMAYGTPDFNDITALRDFLDHWDTEQCNNDDLVWIIFRAAYLEAKSSYFYQAQQDHVAANACSNECIGSSDPGCSDYAQKVPRFGNAALQIGTSNISIADLLQTNSGSQAQALINAQMAAGCQQYAEQAASDWMNLLSGCDFVANGVNIVDLEADMVALISSACDENNPQGASTTPNPIQTSNGVTVSSLEELLAAYGLTESNLCTDLLISTPGVYQTAEQAIAQLEKPLDVCGCDQVLEAELIANDLSISPEEALAQLTGIDLADVDYIICACSEREPSWTPNYAWPSGSNAALEATGITIPTQLSCDECEVDCAMINADISTLEARFNINDFSSAANYETILTNYLNVQYDYTLPFESYETFIGQCGASPSNPYCEVNPFLYNWVEAMNLIAMRGQLLNDNTSQVVLSDENIVFANTGFKESNYWSSQAGNVLSMHYGQTGGNCTIELTTDLDFSSIVGFGNVVPLTTNCSGNNEFEVEVKYIDCGEIKTSYEKGLSNCFEVTTCVCDPTGLVLCDELPELYKDPCYEPRLSQMYQDAIAAYEAEVLEAYADFTKAYNEQCSEAFSTENFNYTGNVREYQYTLFYYDQAGNLTQTVAPEGKTNLLPGELATVNAARDAIQDDQSTGLSVTPDHGFKTTYEYNSYNQLVSTTNPDQEGNTKFWYDRYGRIVASQNPVQANESKYSFSFYDKQGRPFLVGQVEQTNALTEAIAKMDDQGVSFQAWTNAGVLTEVTFTQYDRPIGPAIPAMFANGEQENLRLRVASVIYYAEVNGTLFGDYESATHYSYDIHGNVKEQIQDVPALRPVEQDLKSTQYEYELISGNVEKVSYQEGERDYIAHEYCYDELNRLTEVSTSTDDVHHSREASYLYYDYGPLARTELGQYNVQGSDFAYTINGWLKGLNASTLSPEHDMGHDGQGGYLANVNSVHSLFAADVNAYTMGYFDGDYSPIGASTMELSLQSTDAFAQGTKDLFNGNISHVVNSVYGVTTIGNAYTYDQLQRLKSGTAYYNINTDNSWSGMIATDDYHNTYSYDKNGNLKTLKRNGTVASGLFMDKFTYHYADVAGVASNRLDYVNDYGYDYQNTPGVNDNGDIKSGILPGNVIVPGVGMTAGNYQYDEIGQLLSDEDEGIQEMEWRSGDKKLKRIVRTTQDLNSSEIEFVYNPFGIRVLKIEKPRSSGGLESEDQWKYSYYAYDANGQCMAVYDVTMSEENNQAFLSEQHLYGASRLGMLKQEKLLYDNDNFIVESKDVRENTLGLKRYECTNHLGNVQAVINDRKVAVPIGSASIYEAVVLMTSDYYPFGMKMPNACVGGSQMVETEHVFASGDFETDGDMEDWLDCNGASNTVSNGSLILQASVNAGSGNWAACARQFITGTYIQPGDVVHVEVDVESIDFPVAGLYFGQGTGVNGLYFNQLQVGSNSFTFTAQHLLSNVAIIVNSAQGSGNHQVVVNSIKVWKEESVTVACQGYINNDYRYAYNGMEVDNEVSGNGNHYDYGARMYNPRLGRFLSLDPKMDQYPFMSPYCYAANNPILYIDENGEGPIIGWKVKSKKNADGSLTITVSIDVMRDLIVVNESSTNLTRQQGAKIAQSIKNSYRYNFAYEFSDDNTDDAGIMAELRSLYDHLDPNQKIHVNVEMNLHSNYAAYVESLSEVKYEQVSLIVMVDKIPGVAHLDNPIGLSGLNTDAVKVIADYISPTGFEDNTPNQEINLKKSNTSTHEIIHMDGASDLYTTKNGKVLNKGSGLMGATEAQFSLTSQTKREIAEFWLRNAIYGGGIGAGVKGYQNSMNAPNIKTRKFNGTSGEFRYDPDPDSTPVEDFEEMPLH